MIRFLNRKKIFRRAAKVVLELAIVFVGVYFAFALNSRKEAVAHEKTKTNFYRLIHQDFEFLLKELKMNEQYLGQYLSELEKGMQNGETPVIAPVRRIEMETNQLILRSAFTSGYLENLDAGYVSNLSNGSNYLVRIAQRINDYNHAITLALSTVDFKSNEFYKDGQLRPELAWMIEDLKAIRLYLQQLIVAVEKGAIPNTKQLISD